MKLVKSKIREQDLKKLVVEYLSMQPHLFFCWATNTGTFFFKGENGKSRMFKSGMKGLPDIVGIINGGKFLAIELKVGYNTLSFEQEIFLKKINEMGGVAFEARSLEEVIKHLEKI